MNNKPESTWTVIRCSYNSQAYLHVGVSSPLLEALRALVGLLPGVDPDVIPESGGPGEGLPANVASVWARSLQIQACLVF